MREYSGGIVQSPATIKSYSIIQYNIFQTRKKIAVLVLSVALAVSGIAVAGSNKLLGLGLVFLGCILFSNSNAAAEYTANRVIELFKGNYPTLHYSFSDSYILPLESGKSIKYKSLVRLVEDDDYLYLFENSQYAVMVKKSLISGENGAEGLKKLLAEKTGLSWTRPLSILNFNLSNLLPSKHDKWEGPRLK